MRLPLHPIDACLPLLQRLSCHLAVFTGHLTQAVTAGNPYLLLPHM
jgi:hypothetical protein